MERNKRIKVPDWLKKGRKNHLATVRRYAKKHNISLVSAERELTILDEEKAQTSN